jgi:hypothetical protein
MARFVEPGKRFRVVGVGSTPFLRYADRVSPQMYYKQRFGEFAARPGAGGSLQVERGWVRRNIVHARLPLIGRVTCHRKYVAELRAGLRAIVRAGLADQIKPEEYAGCYNARHIGWDPTERLSSHAWGAAVDINAASNPLGSAPTIDRRIVRLLERAGLNWGGDWLVPDGMHFEWEAPTG